MTIAEKCAWFERFQLRPYRRYEKGSSEVMLIDPRTKVKYVYKDMATLWRCRYAVVQAIGILPDEEATLPY